MARHNYVSVIAFVRKEPKFKDIIDGRAGIVGLTTIMSGRDYEKAKTGYQLNSVSFCARSQEKEIVEEMEKLQLLDIVEITGFLATREVDKKEECPFCNAVNRRVEACVANGKVKSGGNEIFVYPITIRVAFNRGEICWAAPFGHIVWVDENGIPYDISGVNESETDDYIPEYMMGDTILDFKHIAGKTHDTTDQEIAKMQLDWQDIRSKQFGGDVTKIKTKEDAEKYLQQAFPVLWLEDQMVYDKKKEYLKKKFGI